MRSRTCCLLSATLLFLPVRPALAQSTWTGNGANMNWSTPQNWTPIGAPANDGTANIVIAGQTGLSPTVDTPWSINSLRFSNINASFSIVGNPLTIGAGGITNQGIFYAQAVNAPVVLAMDQNWN